MLCLREKSPRDSRLYYSTELAGPRESGGIFIWRVKLRYIKFACIRESITQYRFTNLRAGFRAAQIDNRTSSPISEVADRNVGVVDKIPKSLFAALRRSAGVSATRGPRGQDSCSLGQQSESAAEIRA